MSSTLEVLLGPADYQARRSAGFAGSVCVVFDVLRATSVMLTGLANGAKGIIPVEEIPEAISLRTKHPGALLAGERNGFRITAAQTGGVDFDLGNSPREYTAERVQGRIIISTTTNGTRALRACASAQTVAVASFLNLTATSHWLNRLSPSRVVLICAGTERFPALEDILCAGALCDQLAGFARDDSATAAHCAFGNAQGDLLATIAKSRNGSRLLSNLDLRSDVELCLQRDVFTFRAVLDVDGAVKMVE